MSSLRRLLSVVMVALVLVSPDVSAADPIAPPAFLRTTQPWIAALLSEACPQAPTLQALVDRLRSARVIVYLDALERPDVAWDGRIRYVGVSPVMRYLRIELRHLSPARAAAVLAHELQHVVEVVDADVRSPAEFDALFRRIGFVVRDSPDHVDTVAAIRAGVMTLREFSGSAPTSVRGQAPRR